MLEDLMERVDNMCDQIRNFRKYRTLNRNDRNKKHGTTDEELL